MTKVIVIGLDGGTWDLLMPLAAEGFLPNLHRLVQEGSWGELESTIPPVTAPAWTSFATGKNPGKTGVFDFLVPRNSLTDLSPVTSRDISGKTFYEIIDDYGLSTVLINLPLSYPPRTQQPTITCMLTQGSQFIFPSGLTQTIPDLADYRLVPDFNLRAHGRLEEYAQDIRKLEKVRFKGAQKLFQTEWDFFFLLFSGTDWIQHEFYSKLLSDSLPREHAAFQLLRDIDQYLGWFLEHLPRETHLLLMSDHGFRPYKGVFLLNQWLKEQGLLHSDLVGRNVRVYSHLFEKRMAEADERKATGGNRMAAVRASVKMLLAEEMQHLRSGRLLEVIEELNPIRLGKQASVHYPSTVAACTSPQLSGVYLNSATRFQDGLVPDQDLISIKNRIISGLSGLRDPATQLGAFASVLDNSEAYSGDKAHLGPDIVVRPDNWLVISFVPKTTRTSLFRPKKTDSHSAMGMFLVYGPRIKGNHNIRDVRIQDIAPTVLRLLGVPLPGDLDGRVVTELFDTDVPCATDAMGNARVQEVRRIGARIGKLRDCRSM